MSPSQTRALFRLERTLHLIQGRDGEGAEGGREGEKREGGREGRGERERGREGEGGREGGITVICMFNINPIIPQYLNNNLTWYYVIT